MIGSMISHYKIVERLGGGGMAAVYKAEDQRLGRFVALKFLPLSQAEERRHRDRFLLEARTASALDHPNICTIFDIGASDDGQLFIAMAYYPGQTLSSRLREGPLEVAEALDVACQVASGLVKAHEHGILHRDIKPANLILTQEGLVKILDFGIAKLLHGESLTREGVTLGTAAYMSPEQARGLELSAATDLWSLGAVLYEMLTGVRPFQRDHEAATITAILHHDPPPFGEHLPSSWKEVERVVGRCLSRDLQRRYRSAGELLADLNDLLDRPGPPTVALRPARNVEPSIAVLPFADLSPQQDQEYFCSGMAEEIIDALTKIPGLRVASRTSATHFAQRGAEVREIGRQLQVLTVLEGSVRKAAEHLRITVQLVDAEDGYHLWSAKFDRELQDVFAIQEEIARTVAHTLQLTLMRATAEPLIAEESRSLEAYNFYLKGRFHWNRRTEDALRKATGYFQLAIEEEPTYARAFAGLAACYTILGVYGALPPREVMPKATAAAERTLELDPSLAEAESALGTVRAVYEGDWPRAEAHFRRALEIDPGNAVTHQWMAVHLLIPQGRFEEAEAALWRAAKLEPLSLPIATSLGLPDFFRGRPDKAEAAYRSALEIDPTFGLAHLFLGRALEAQGRTEEALASLERAREITGDTPETLSSLGYTLARAGRREEAEGLLEALLEKVAQRYVSPLRVAEIYAGLGDSERALAALEEAASLKAADLVWAHRQPVLSELQSSPRFRRLMDQRGLG